MPKPTGLFILPKENYELIYSPQQVAWIAELVDLLAPQLEPQAVRDNPALLAGVELVFTGWGSLTYAAEILQAAPDLKMVFYGAGSVRSTVTDAFWERGVRITSAGGQCRAGGGVLPGADPPVPEENPPTCRGLSQRAQLFAIACGRRLRLDDRTDFPRHDRANAG
jgi:hypothetical protein